tara:strand:- start:1229 stop:2335 length:1107 start_codon:yes stop_codon:yes gene_type:complete
MDKTKFNLNYLNLIKCKIYGDINYNDYFKQNNFTFNIGCNEDDIIDYNIKKKDINIIRRKINRDLFFYELKNKPKYEVLYNILFNNNFNCNLLHIYSLDIEKKIQCLTMFFLIQKIIFNLRKIIYLYRIKKKVKIYNEKNLLLDDFSLNEKIFYLYDFKNINSNTNNITCYKFSPKELYKICEKNIISYDASLFYDNIDIKNPYSNLSFSKAQLYNIYLFLVENLKLQFPLFHAYYSCEFDKVYFMFKYDNLIKENIINDYYKNLNNDGKISLFLSIIKNYYPININFNELDISIFYNFFKKKKIIVYHFLMYKYSYNQNINNYHYKIMKDKIYETYEINPLLGRKIYKFNKNNKIISYTINKGNNLY